MPKQEPALGNVLAEMVKLFRFKVLGARSVTFASGVRLSVMAARKTRDENNFHEALSQLILNQGLFVEQIARTDQERLELQRRADLHHRSIEAWQAETKKEREAMEASQRKSEERLLNIEKRLIGVEERLKKVETVLLQLPQTIRKEVADKKN